MIHSIIDERTRVLGQAARVSAKYEHMGVMASFALWARQRTLERVPTLTGSVNTRTDPDAVAKTLKRNPTSMKLMTKRVGSHCTC